MTMITAQKWTFITCLRDAARAQRIYNTPELAADTDALADEIAGWAGEWVNITATTQFDAPSASDPDCDNDNTPPEYDVDPRDADSTAPCEQCDTATKHTHSRYLPLYDPQGATRMDIIRAKLHGTLEEIDINAHNMWNDDIVAEQIRAEQADDIATMHHITDDDWDDAVIDMDEPPT